MALLSIDKARCSLALLSHLLRHLLALIGAMLLLLLLLSPLSTLPVRLTSQLAGLLDALASAFPGWGHRPFPS